MPSASRELLNIAVRLVYLGFHSKSHEPISALSTYLVLYTMPTTPQV